MKKILHIPTGLYVAGAQKIARDVGLRRDKDRFAIDYVVFTDKTEAYEPELLAGGCRVFHLALPAGGLSRYAKMYSQLKDLMRREAYDAVHAHGMFMSAIPIAAAKAAGVPIRITHSHNSSHYKWRFSAFCDSVLRRIILRDSTVLAACGDAAGEFLFGKRAYKRRGTLILNGADTDAFRFSPEKREALRSALSLQDRFVIGIVARLEPSKNHGFLIELLPELLKRRPDAVLLVVGDGNERSVLEQRIAAAGLGAYVIFSGVVSDVPGYLNAMDVFALPSLFEGVPLTLMEAQANGLPCVMSENVPREVAVTDLIKTIPLADRNGWIQAICAAERRDPGSCADLMRARGLDYSAMLQKIYQLYGPDSI